MRMLGHKDERPEVESELGAGFLNCLGTAGSDGRRGGPSVTGSCPPDTPQTFYKDTW